MTEKLALLLGVTSLVLFVAGIVFVFVSNSLHGTGVVGKIVSAIGQVWIVVAIVLLVVAGITACVAMLSS